MKEQRLITGGKRSSGGTLITDRNERVDVIKGIGWNEAEEMEGRILLIFS